MLIGPRPEMLTARRTNAQLLRDVVRCALFAWEMAGTRGRTARDRAVARDAMLYNLGVVGVAARGMSRAFRARHRGVPWSRVISFRAILDTPDRRLDEQMVDDAVGELVPLLLERLSRNVGTTLPPERGHRDHRCSRSQGRATPTGCTRCLRHHTRRSRVISVDRLGWQSHAIDENAACTGLTSRCRSRPEKASSSQESPSNGAARWDRGPGAL